eukprot:11050660-Alexandrium_andersonii.AAC.1
MHNAANCIGSYMAKFGELKDEINACEAGCAEWPNKVVIEHADGRNTADTDENVFEAKDCMQLNVDMCGMTNSAM